MAKIIIPLPSRDFDPTEAAVPWLILSRAGHDVLFATPDGLPGEADLLMVTGEGLDLWGFLPGIKKIIVLGRLLRANADGRAAYRKMSTSSAFQNPLRWEALDVLAFDGLILPGGHRARGMRDYLESSVLQALTVDFFRADKPVGAICHGVLVAARAIDPETGKSVLHERKTSSLTWSLERSAAALGRIIRFWDSTYYRTYSEKPGQPVGYMSVEQEVTRALANPTDYQDVPTEDMNFRRKSSGLARDSQTDRTPGFVVQDGNYVSARWPGDAHSFAARFADLLATPSVQLD